MSKKNPSRREFLKNTAIVGTAGASGLLLQTSGCARQASMEWEKEADVVVIGAGATGLPAAIKAAEEEKIGFSAVLYLNKSEIERWPRRGPIVFTVPGEDYEVKNWIV